jgi:hypothetical protein
LARRVMTVVSGVDVAPLAREKSILVLELVELE